MSYSGYFGHHWVRDYFSPLWLTWHWRVIWVTYFFLKWYFYFPNRFIKQVPFWYISFVSHRNYIYFILVSPERVYFSVTKIVIYVWFKYHYQFPYFKNYDIRLFGQFPIWKIILKTNYLIKLEPFCYFWQKIFPILSNSENWTNANSCQAINFLLMLYKTYNFKQADIWALDHVYVGICELNSKNVLSQIITISFTLGQSI